jgi:hypothetical protein
MILLKILALGLILGCFMQLCRRAGHVLADADEMYGHWWLVLLAVALIAPTLEAGGIRTFHSRHGTGRSPQQAMDAPQADPPRPTHSLFAKPKGHVIGECPTCHGSGKKDGAQCPMCWGTGMVEYSSAAKSSGQSLHQVRCPHCLGMMGHKDCPQCHGTGWVMVFSSSECKCCDKCTGRPGCPCKCDDCKCNEKAAAPTQPTQKRRGLLKRLRSGGPLSWIDWNPRGCRNDCDIYSDVLSRANAGNYPDAATRCHESTHVLDSKISNAHVGSRGFYVGNGRAMLLAKPRATLSAVARRVTKYRNINEYQLYLVKAQQWYEHDPLEVLEEFNAYCNDLQCQRERHMGWQGTEDRCTWFSHWADCMVETVKEQDPNYRDLDMLVSFVEWEKDRAQKLIDSQPHANHHASYRPRQDAKLEALMQCDESMGLWTWLRMLWPVGA